MFDEPGRAHCAQRCDHALSAKRPNALLSAPRGQRSALMTVTPMLALVASLATLLATTAALADPAPRTGAA